MINLPCNAASMSQVTPCQNVPVQTSQYNFPTCQQRQTSTQQMQTAACGPCSGISQGPCAHVYQPDTFMVTHQCTTGAQPVANPCHPVFQSPYGAPPPTHPGYTQLPQNILDQIRACVSNAAPIFIMPGSCQQSQVSQQQQQPSVPTSPQVMTSAPTTAAYAPSGLTYPAPCYPPPSPPPPPPPFYPYPVPLPFCDPFLRARETTQNCGCCRRRDVDPLSDARNIARAGCRLYDSELDEHRCTPTTDDTICSKRNCPSSLHLQALASQFLSMQGIIACAATRLVLRKVPGSNVTTTMEDTMARAQRSINALTKDQLLSESRNAQQVNALINLHMTANPPPNIIPILTLVQLKMNLLKAQVEGLVNQKLMETQGVGVEVETDLIDPTILALKSDAELRDFLSVLRQKECDERVNVNFAPYRSQRAIAETRLRNVQNKLRQVEAEFDRRRCAMLPAPTLSTRVVQQFSRPCYSARFEDPRRLYTTLPSPDPFAARPPPSPKRLLLKKPCAGNPESPAPQTAAPGVGARADGKTDGAGRTKEQSVATDPARSSAENCACCDRTMSEDSVCETKKKLRPRIVEIDATVSDVAGGLREASLVKLTSDVCVRIGAKRRCRTKRCDFAPGQGVPCEQHDDPAGCWVAKAYVNDDESVKTEMTESESDTITLGERVDAEDVCVSRDAIRDDLERIMDREARGSSTDLRRYEERAEAKIVISQREEEESDVRPASSPDISKTEREETKVTTTVAEVVDDGRILSVPETAEPSGMYTSSLQITLKPTREVRADERRANGNGETTSPLTANGTEERGANKVSISKSKKRTRFHIVSLLTNIVYDKDRKYRTERKTDEKTATNGRETASVTTPDPDIEKLYKYSSVNDLLRSAIAHDITEKDRSKNIFPEVPNLSKLYVDRQCQTIFKTVAGENDTLLRANIFPPFKHSRRYVADNEKNGRDVGTYQSPIAKAEVTDAKRFSRCNNVTENTLGILCEDKNAPYLSNVEREGNFISGIFSLIGNRVVTLVNKIITLNGRLIYSSRGVISRKGLNVDTSGKYALVRDRSGKTLKDYESFAATFHYPPDSPSQGTSTSNKHIPHDTNLLRVSTGEGYDRIRKVRHSIIEDGKNGAKYLLISTSNHNRDPQLACDLGHPYEVQRSLLIRSRLKNSQNSQHQDLPRPFTLLKRTKKNILESYRAKCDAIGMIEGKKMCELKDSETFKISPKVTKTSENDGKLSEKRKHDDKFVTKNLERYNDDIIEQISYKSLNDNIRNSVFIKQERAVNNELVINVHDYLGLQTEINTNIYENRSECLLITDKAVES